MLGFLSALVYALPAAAEAEKESTVRAAFLYRLAFFVSWPEQRFADARTPIRFCLEQAVPKRLRAELKGAAKQRQVNQRPLVVQDWSGGSEGCDVLYLSGSQAAPPNMDSGTLVVVDSSETLRDVGQLALVRESGSGGETRLVFHGHRSRIAEAGYTLSSKLLSLVRFDGE